MAYNLDPNRARTHVVIDNFDEIGQEGVYSGSYNDCVDFIASQEDGGIIGMYEIYPISWIRNPQSNS